MVRLLAGLATLNRDLIARAETIDSPYRVVLDMDSTEIPVYGQQEQSPYKRTLRVDRLSQILAPQSEFVLWVFWLEGNVG